MCGAYTRENPRTHALSVIAASAQWAQPCVCACVCVGPRLHRPCTHRSGIEFQVQHSHAQCVRRVAFTHALIFNIAFAVGVLLQVSQHSAFKQQNCRAHTMRIDAAMSSATDVILHRAEYTTTYMWMYLTHICGGRAQHVPNPTIIARYMRTMLHLVSPQCVIESPWFQFRRIQIEPTLQLGISLQYGMMMNCAQTVHTPKTSHPPTFKWIARRGESTHDARDALLGCCRRHQLPSAAQPSSRRLLLVLCTIYSTRQY